MLGAAAGKHWLVTEPLKSVTSGLIVKQYNSWFATNSSECDSRLVHQIFNGLVVIEVSTPHLQCGRRGAIPRRSTISSISQILRTRVNSNMNPRIQKECKKHGITIHILEKKTGYFRCGQCRNQAVMKRRRNVKLKLIQACGGKCKQCGYDKCPAVLEFHHLQPEHKQMGVSNGHTMSFDRLLIEAQKCQLLCANCHRETEFLKDSSVG